jgi:hypothetical protein
MDLDETEPIRRVRLVEINSAVESHNQQAERKRLENQHGQVWDAMQLAAEFDVIGFAAPYVVVKRKAAPSTLSIRVFKASTFSTRRNELRIPLASGFCSERIKVGLDFITSGCLSMPSLTWRARRVSFSLSQLAASIRIDYLLRREQKC